MDFSNDRTFSIIVDILDIRQEPENLAELENWIQRAGIDEVFKKIIQIYSTDLIY